MANTTEALKKAKAALEEAAKLSDRHSQREDDMGAIIAKKIRALSSTPAQQTQPVEPQAQEPVAYLVTAEVDNDGNTIKVRHLHDYSNKDMAESHAAELRGKVTPLYAAPVSAVNVRGKSQEPTPQITRDQIRKLIEGMTVSIDVSTGEHDAGNRLYGHVNEVMDSPPDKNGLTLLVYETSPNFSAAAPALPQQTEAQQSDNGEQE